jgi:hypothetical protein
MAIDYNIEEEIRESLDKSLKQFPKRDLPLGGARPASEVAKERGVLGRQGRAMGGARPAGDVAKERSILGGKKEVEIIERPEKVELKTPAEILFDTKIAEATEALEQKFAEALVNLSRDFITTDDVESLVSNKIPIAIRHLDSIPPSGNVLKLGTGGVGHWGRITEGEGEGEGGLDWSICSLGYKCDPDGNDPDKVRIYAGEIDRNAVAQTDKTVANNDYVYVRRTIADDTMTVLNGASVPADDATYKYYRLYRFTVTEGVASIQTIYRPFDIEERIELPSTAEEYQVLAWNGSAWVADWVRWV